MPTYQFIDANSKIKIHGKWYNESNLDSKVVNEFLQYNPNFLGVVFKEKQEATLPIINEIVNENPTNGKSTKTEKNSKKEAGENADL